MKSYLDFIGIIISATIGIVSLVKTIRNEKKLASKEHELAEGLKSDILQLIGVLTSIRYKIMLKQQLPEDVSLDDEIKAINKSRLTCGYVFLMYRIPSGDRLLFEVRIQLIASGNNLISINLIDAYALGLIRTLLKLANDITLGDEIQQILKKMNEDEFLKEVNPQIPDEFTKFVYYLIENGITDPDVLLFYGVFENNVDIVKKALDDGADTKCTDKMILSRYEKEYKEFLMTNNK